MLCPSPGPEDPESTDFAVRLLTELGERGEDSQETHAFLSESPLDTAVVLNVGVPLKVLC